MTRLSRLPWRGKHSKDRRSSSAPRSPWFQMKNSRYCWTFTVGNELIVNVYDRDRQQRFLSAYFQMDMVMGKACLAAGVSIYEVKKWLKDDEVFLEAYNLGRADFIAMLKAKAYEIARRGDDPQFLLQVIEREDPTWDPKLRAIEATRRKDALDWQREVLEGKVEKIEDPFSK